MPNTTLTWDDIDNLPDGTLTDIDNVLFNKYGECIKQLGFGETPGTVTWDGNQNHIGSLGHVEFHGTGGFHEGTLGAPGIRFYNDSNNGLHLPAADTVDIVTGGVTGLRVTSAGVTHGAWQTISSVGSGWLECGVAQGYPASRYRLDSLGGLRVDLTVQVTSGTPAGVITNLPAPYRPPTLQHGIGWDLTTGNIWRSLFTTGGDLNFTSAPAWGINDFLHLSAYFYTR